MGSEYTSPRLYGDPCHLYASLYQHFLVEPSVIPTSDLSDDSSSTDKPPLQSMLVTGFGMRNWDSLQRALLDDEQRRQMLLAQHDTGESFECQSLNSDEYAKLHALKEHSKTSIHSRSDVIDIKSLSLQYLMGLDAEAEEMPERPFEEFASMEGEVEEEVDPRMSDAMRKARKFLRQHRIFEFFRFLIAHMLSELPDNPIQFLIDLLDRCLLYRSGFGNPPLLFEKPHLEQLFLLMDRMKTGVIEVEQYEAGMKTLGICSYDKNPPLTTEGMVGKEFFVEEAYECLADLFVDMIRRRGGQVTPPSLVTPPPTAVVPSLASGGQ